MSQKFLSKNLQSDNNFFKIHFAKELLHNLHIKSTHFQECDFAAKLNWQASILQECAFTGCQFMKNSWTKARITNCQFVQCMFTHSIWQEVQFVDCTFVNCDLRSIQFENCFFESCLIDSVQFTDRGQWSGQLHGTKLLRSVWPDMAINWSRTTESHFYQIDWLNKAFPWTQAQGTVFDDCTMGECHFHKLQLTDLTFSRCQFECLDLMDAVLINVDFIESQLKKINAIRLSAEYLQMGRVCIEEGIFEDITITGATLFTESRLKKVCFKRAQLAMTVFEKAILEECHFEQVESTGTNFAEVKGEGSLFNFQKLNSA